MQAEATIPVTALYGFLMVLSRVSGALVMVPIPGVRNTPQPVRALLALAFTMTLAPMWPEITESPGMGKLVGWLMAEAALGLTVGLAVTLLTEALLFCAQMVGLQAGYGYAQTVDPTTQADASLLLVLAQLVAGLLFFTLGLHREVLRVFARSLEVCPPGQFVVTYATAEGVVRLGAGIFSIGLRLALPVLATLILVDLALALLGRVNAQLQLLMLAFPAKMLLGLVVLSLTAALFPRVYRAYAGEVLAGLRGLTGF